MTRPRRDDEGFSLVEVLVGISLLLLIVTLSANAVITGMRHQTTLSERSTAMAEMRTAAQRMSREIRQADPVAVARDRSLVVWQPTSGGFRELAWSVVGTELVLDERDLTAAGVTTSALPRRTVLRSLDPSASLFGYVPSTSFTAAPGVTATCEITGSSPRAFSRDCIGSITLRLSHVLRQGSPIVLDQTVELRNR